MCRGENVQCKECFRLTPRVVQLCIRGELMVTCPDTIIEGVSLEKEECRLCRYGNSKGKIIMPPSVIANANDYDRQAWRAAKEQHMPQPVRRFRRLKGRDNVGCPARKEGKEEPSSILHSFEQSQVGVQVHSLMADSHKSKGWNSLDNEVQVDNHQTRLDVPEEEVMEESAVMVNSSEQDIPFLSKGEEIIKLSHQTACEA
ncbi:hypothetical protein ACHAPA_007987 [Fusarium lateritium]